MSLFDILKEEMKNAPEESIDVSEIVPPGNHVMIESGNVHTANLTKTALGKFIKWSTSRYNELSKAQVISLALDILTGKRALENTFCVVQSGSYTPSSTMTHFSDYAIGPNFVSSGIAHWNYETRNWIFTEKERLAFNV